MPARRSDYILLNQQPDVPYYLESCLAQSNNCNEKCSLFPLEEQAENDLARSPAVPIRYSVAESVSFFPVEKHPCVAGGKYALSYSDRNNRSDRVHHLVENHHFVPGVSCAFLDRDTNTSTKSDSCIITDRFAAERWQTDRELQGVVGEQIVNQSLDQGFYKAGLWPSLDRNAAGDGCTGRYGGAGPSASCLLQRQSSGSSFTDSLLSSDVPLSTLSPTVSLSASDSMPFSTFYEDGCKQDGTKGVRQGDGSSQSWAQQTEQIYNLQLALALRVVADAELTEEPFLSSNYKHISIDACSAGRSSVEATALRFWVNGSLGYSDKIQDGFYHIWGMNFYVWIMCTNADVSGRMPLLDSLRAVDPADTSMEVILIDKHVDSYLRELEDQALSYAYKASDLQSLAEYLGKLVCQMMGGAAISEHGELTHRWKSSSRMLKDCLNCVVLPIGNLSVGLCRHRALLFKALADTVNLPCRITRGCKYCGLDDGVSCLVLCDNERELLVDLIAEPGALCSPESFLRCLPVIPIASPLRLPQFKSSYIREDGSERWKYAFDCKTTVSFANGGQGSWENSQTMDANPSCETLGDTFRGNDPLTGKTTRVQSAVEYSKVTNIEKCVVTSKSLIDKMSKFPSRVDLVAECGRPIKEVNTLPSKVRGGDGLGLSVPKDIAIFQKDMSQNSPLAVHVRNDGHFLPQQLTLQPENQMALKPSSKISIKETDRAEEKRAEEKRLEAVEESGGTVMEAESLELSLALDGLEIPWEDLILKERIGAGSFGAVYRAEWHGSDVAVKVLIEQDFHEERLKEFIREVAIMKRVRHQNVVLFMGAVTKRPNLSIVTEYLPRGSLFRLLHRTGIRDILDEKRRIRMALDVAKGMNYLHRHNPPIVHRDLKSQNLLVYKMWTVKVCDFGLSRFKANTFLSSRSAAGTPEWMAPEVLRDELSNEKCDVYSFGVILWELVTFQQPWSGLSPAQVVGAVGFQNRRLQIPKDVNPDITEIIESCWASDPRQRPSFASIMESLESLKALQKSSAATAVGAVGA